MPVAIYKDGIIKFNPYETCEDGARDLIEIVAKRAKIEDERIKSPVYMEMSYCLTTLVNGKRRVVREHIERELDAYIAWDKYCAFTYDLNVEIEIE